jgi:hypothetical protein
MGTENKRLFKGETHGRESLESGIDNDNGILPLLGEG